MVVGFIGDSHSSVKAWQNAMAHGLAECDLIVHTGDVLYHGPRNPLPDGHNPAELAALINSCSKPILIAKGNCDAAIDQVMIDFPIISPCVSTNACGMNIICHHGDILTSSDIMRYSSALQASLIVSGHTHLRVLEREGKLIYLNPGSCSLPKAQDKRPSFAVFDGSCIKIVDVSCGTLLDKMDL
jgi:putative phosphoesterase